MLKERGVKGVREVVSNLPCCSSAHGGHKCAHGWIFGDFWCDLGKTLFLCV